MSLRAAPSLRGRHTLRDCRMGMKKPFHPLGRCALRQVLLRQLVHRRNKRLDAGDRFKRIPVGLPLVVSRLGIEGRHQQQRKRGRGKSQQGQVREVRKFLEHVVVDRVVEHPVRDPET